MGAFFEWIKEILFDDEQPEMISKIYYEFLDEFIKIAAELGITVQWKYRPPHLDQYVCKLWLVHPSEDDLKQKIPTTFKREEVILGGYPYFEIELATAKRNDDKYFLIVLKIKENYPIETLPALALDARKALMDIHQWRIYVYSG